MLERSILKKSILLRGESDGTYFKRTFKIIKKISEGSSTICYEAYHSGSGRGVIKEFYPQDTYVLERDENGQLIPDTEFADEYQRFLSAEKDYIEPYEMLLREKQSSKNKTLSTFIPAFEIYHGCDEACNTIGTTYIWMPEPELETFDKICSDIHKHPTIKPERKLVTVLLAIKSLSECICALHSAGLIHRDIKPSNFGFVKRGDQTLTQTLSMFDINSVCSIYSKSDCVMGTEGYIEPEAGYEIFNNQTDIYSIGATLFYAIIVNDETKKTNNKYYSGYYDCIQNLVNESELIRASEANSHPRLRNILCKILKKCLCERNFRYANCEELIEDLKDALYYALPSEYAQKSLQGEKWLLADVEKKLDKSAEHDSTTAIQFHLYDYPLYKYTNDEFPYFNILIVGFGNYGQKFLDECLQVGQMKGKHLNVTVLSGDNVDKDIYLSARPQLDRFFNIDGSCANDEDSYGKISFQTVRFGRSKKGIEKTIRALGNGHGKAKQIQYVFIALGEDNFNSSVARACSIALSPYEDRIHIAYVHEGENPHCFSSETVFPICLDAKKSKKESYIEVERMAFNTHLVWEKNLFINHKNIRKTYNKKYNHNSCICSVLSLKYKLYSIGLDIDQMEIQQVAEEASRIISDSSHSSIKDELVWLEHRRWVTEKLCLGWQSIDCVEDCAEGITKDEKNKRHICILKSQPNRKLAELDELNGTHLFWDTATEQELSELDDLDRMSVELHRMYSEKAEDARMRNAIPHSTIKSIATLVKDHLLTNTAFHEWLECINDIWNGDCKKVKIYKSAAESFVRAANEMPDDKIHVLKEQIKAFEASFYPIVASLEYRDWKQNDVLFIENIPFILLHSRNYELIVPFIKDNNTELFGNVAAATLIDPQKIVYLCSINDKQDISEIIESLSSVVKYLDKKQLRATIDINWICNSDQLLYLCSEMGNDAFIRNSNRIKNVKCLINGKNGELLQELKRMSVSQNALKKQIAFEINDTDISNKLKELGFYSTVFSYRFDSRRMVFSSPNGKRLLGLSNKEAFISVSDVETIASFEKSKAQQPEFFLDFRSLWNTYRLYQKAWSTLCELLSAKSQKDDILACFETRLFKVETEKAEKHRYVLPSTCGPSIEKIINFLKQEKVIYERSCVSYISSNLCEVIVAESNGYGVELDRLFSQIYCLLLPGALSTRFADNGRLIQISFNNLNVSNLSIPPSEFDEIRELLQLFANYGFIIGLHYSENNKISFTYSNEQIKELLTSERKMMEVYTYHKLKEMSSFDDVISGYEIILPGDDNKYRIGCIATKGFITLLIDIVALTDKYIETRNELLALTSKMGENVMAIIVIANQLRIPDGIDLTNVTNDFGNNAETVVIMSSDEIDNLEPILLNKFNIKCKLEG